MDELDRFAGFLAGRGTKWLEWFGAYSWRGADADCGIRARFRLHRALTASLEPRAPAGAFPAAVGEILEWGGMRRLDDFDLDLTRATLTVLHTLGDDQFAVDHRQVFGRRIAATSKVYAMSDPRRWTIYDSRVGLAIQALVAAHLGDADLPERLDFRQPPARGDPPITPAQARRGFLRASRVLRQTAALLDVAGVPRPACAVGCADDTGGWQVYHLEMALFMLGRNGGDLGDG